MESAAREELRHREDSAGLKVEISSLDDSFIDEPAAKEEKVVVKNQPNNMSQAKTEQKDNKNTGKPTIAQSEEQKEKDLSLSKAFEIEMAKTTSNLKSVSAEKRALAIQVEDLLEEKRQHEKQISSRQKQIDSLKQLKGKKVASLVSQLEETSRKNADLKRRVKDLESNDDQEEAIRKAENELRDANSVAQKLQRRLEVAEGTNETLMEEVNECRRTSSRRLGIF